MAYTKYSLTPANNTATPPDGAPEGMLPSAVNDTMRDMMAQIRDCGDGIRDGTYTMTAAKITGGTITGVTLTGNTFSNPTITGVSTFAAGTVSAPAITTTGDTNTGIFFPAADTIAFTEGGVESMRIDSDGDVGIGTSSPGAKLDISGGTINFARIDGSTNGGGWLVRRNGATTGGIYNTGAILGDTTSGVGIFSETGYDIRLYTNGSTTERMRIDSIGQVGVGVTPNTWSTGKVVEVGASGTSLWGLSSGTSYVTAGYYFNSTDKFALTGNYAVFSQLVPSDGSFRWRASTATGTAGNDATMETNLTLTQNGTLVLKNGNTAATGIGITFPATQSASSNANTLDDYEEGTWTPTISGSGGNPTITYATRVGYYTKVGRVVTIHCGLQPNDTSANGSGDLQFTGLPFTSSSLTDCVATGVSGVNGNLNWGTNKTGIVFAIGSNTTTINVYATQNATDQTGIPVSNFNNSTKYVFFSITYITST